MRADIISRQAQSMQASGLDAIVSCSPENFAYAAGFVVSNSAVDPPSARDGDCHGRSAHRNFRCRYGSDDDREARTGRSGSHRGPNLATIRWPCSPTNSPIAGWPVQRIGIEMDYLPAGDFARLTKALPHARFDHCEDLLARLRQIKTADEIALLRRLSRIADQAITDALRARPGRRQRNGYRRRVNSARL